jgi:hypothetical protein
MRAPFQEGEFPAPVKYGYSSVGVVEEGPPDLLGRPVFCLFPHQSAYVVPTDAVLPMPQGVPPARAVLAANLETAVNALWDAPPRIGDRVAVVGAGVVGALVAWLAGQVPGCRVQLIDIDPGRAALVRRAPAGHGASRRRPRGGVVRPGAVFLRTGPLHSLSGLASLPPHATSSDATTHNNPFRVLMMQRSGDCCRRRPQKRQPTATVRPQGRKRASI